MRGRKPLWTAVCKRPSAAPIEESGGQVFFAGFAHGDEAGQTMPGAIFDGFTRGGEGETAVGCIIPFDKFCRDKIMLANLKRKNFQIGRIMGGQVRLSPTQKKEVWSKR